MFLTPNQMAAKILMNGKCMNYLETTKLRNNRAMEKK